MIIFPQIIDEKKPVSYNRLSRADAVERLKESQFARYISDSQSFFRIQEKSHRSLNYEEFSSRLAAETACYDFYLGPQTYQDTHVSDEVRDLLIQAQKAKDVK
jgi:hypothetical protein